MTLDDYAAFRGRHRIALREEYGALMRQGRNVELPALTRHTEADGVIKFCLPAGERNGLPLETESVIIPMTSYRASSWYTLCISSQVGCRMGCTFCETGRMGLLHNLTAAQIVRQRLVARQILLARHPDLNHAADRRSAVPPHCYFADGIRNIVFMGMGEPLDNFDQVTQAIRVFSDPAGLDFPRTQITLSTVGRIDGLRKLATLDGGGWHNLRIAISLNAANDALRNQLMPINKGMPLAELQRALLEYPMNKKGRFLIEYVLIKGVNDSLADADAVAAWCKPLRCIVNLIPYNPQRFSPYETPADQTVLDFLFRLKSHHIFTKRRITHGRDLMGACGQLGNPEVRRSAL